ncbi:hypothetical protein [Streptomyces lomondensis]|uniref:Secreted protein n=1 Tax=Streptomyces lomondensis TaxID=68229 RepID=A0ABQ2XLX0_9ACTN|nr:hypothetical protein [Streptomyces lomondensis]MCF0076585.1 hypothetical protein [Streptomyces lomondensis]GGX23443.1 hypothetical protein GCM10010383_62110 [Streptomyces lomondensis]
MREKLPAAALCAVALVGVLAPSAAAAPALPLPLPAAGTEPLLSEAIGIEGPLIQNVSLPTLK